MTITHDPNQLLKDRDLSKITSDICLEKDENIKDFLKDNPHLIEYKNLAKNYSNWSFDMCVDYINDNNNYINNKDYYTDIFKILIIYNQKKLMNNTILVDKLISFIKDNKFFKPCNNLIFYNEEIYNITLDRIKKIKNINKLDKEYYNLNINYILRYCNLETYLELCKLNENLNIINLENIFLNPTFEPNEILLNENDNVVDYVIKCFESYNKNNNIHRFIFNFISNKNSKAVNYIINNNLITNEITIEVINMRSMLLNDNDIMVKYIIDNKLINKKNIFYFSLNKNPIAIEYCKNFKLD